MPLPDATFAETITRTHSLNLAIRHIREVALREVMAMVNRLQPPPHEDVFGSGFHPGFLYARTIASAEIELMIAREAPTTAAQAGYTSDGLEDGAVCDLCGGSGEIRAMWDRGPNRPPGNGYIRCSVCNGQGRVKVDQSTPGYQ